MEREKPTDELREAVRLLQLATVSRQEVEDFIWHLELRYGTIE